MCVREKERGWLIKGEFIMIDIRLGFLVITKEPVEVA